MLGRKLVWVAVLGLSAGACGGESQPFTDAPIDGGGNPLDAAGAGIDGGGNSPDAAGAAIALSDLPPKYAAAFCTSFENCTGKDLVKLFLNGTSCTDYFQHALQNGTFPMLQSRIDSGKMTYDGVKVQACLDAITARTCAQMEQRDPPECLAAFDGTVALGGDCTLDEECKGSAICQSATGTCPGKCVSLLVAGQACTKDGDCQSGLLCSKETALCVQPVGADQKCEYGQPPCASGLVCLGKDDTNKIPGTCKASAQAFAAAEGAVCDPQKGQMCKTGVSCAAISLTLVPLTITYQCVRSGSYAVGAACKIAFPEACATGNYCKVSNALQPLDGTCTALPQVGEACDDKKGPLCRTGAACVSNKCQNFAANGVSCTGNAMCYSENCASGGCEAKLPCK